jgi:hypothetical protein
MNGRVNSNAQSQNKECKQKVLLLGEAAANPVPKTGDASAETVRNEINYPDVARVVNQ